MSNFNIGLSADRRTAYVTVGADALPGGATEVLTDFKHGRDAGVAFETTDLVHDNPHNHVLYHDVREALYRIGILDMQSVSIVLSGALSTVKLFAPALNLEVGGTATIIIKYMPELANAVNTDFTYVSSNEGKATVSSAGVVTGVSGGTIEIVATHKATSKTVTIGVTITDETTG